MVPVSEINNKVTGVSVAFRNGEGCVLVKKYDHTFRRIVAGKWVLFDADGVCLGQSKFFDQTICPPPFAWVEQKLKEQKFLKSHGF